MTEEIFIIKKIKIEGFKTVIKIRIGATCGRVKKMYVNSVLQFLQGVMFEMGLLSV